MIDANSAEEALLSIPIMIRKKGKAIGLVQFDPEKVINW
jgi:hypothetical protein